MSTTTTTTPTFRAAVVRTPGGPDAIEIIDVPVLEPGPGQVRVEIAAAAVNPVDLALASGVFHELGLIRQSDHTGLGWDFAGVVTETGPNVDLRVGSRVAGLVDGFDRDFGTYAEQLVVPAINTALVPSGLDLATAATVPLNGLAAAQLVDLLGDGRGRSLLVTGAAGAVGGMSSRSPRTAAGGSPDWPGHTTRSSSGASAPTSLQRPRPGGTRSPTVPCSSSRASRWSAMAASSAACNRAGRPQRSVASPSAWS